MNRSTVLSTLVLAAVIAIVGAFAVGPSLRDANAQDTSTEDHPIVGTWLLVDTEGPEEPPSLVIFTSDGIYQQTDYDGTTGYGVWEATGPTSAAMTFMQQFSDEGGEFGGSVTIRAVIEVDPSGEAFSADFTLEFEGEGVPSGEFGPGGVTATRMTVEPMGTPVGTLDDLFSAFSEEEGTPEAGTPTS